MLGKILGITAAIGAAAYAGYKLKEREDEKIYDEGYMDGYEEARDDCCDCCEGALVDDYEDDCEDCKGCCGECGYLGEEECDYSTSTNNTENSNLSPSENIGGLDEPSTQEAKTNEKPKSEKKVTAKKKKTEKSE